MESLKSQDGSVTVKSNLNDLLRIERKSERGFAFVLFCLFLDHKVPEPRVRPQTHLSFVGLLRGRGMRARDDYCWERPVGTKDLGKYCWWDSPLIVLLQ